MSASEAAERPAPYRAKLYLKRMGVSLSQLRERFGRSETTWSLFLAAERQIPRGREAVEGILEERGIDVPAWLWEAETPETELSLGRGLRGADTFTRPEVLMDAQTLSDGARERFRLFNDPFDAYAIAGPDGQPRLGALYLSHAHHAVHLRLKQALYAQGFAAASGPPGTGKSLLLQRAIADARALAEPHQLVVITPANIERRRMTLGHIVAELIRHLTDRRLPQAANQRDALLQELLLARSRAGDRVALVIDEAHELPQETLKDTKRLREGHYGFIPLLGIILVGQLELKAKLDSTRNPLLTEVALRAQKVELGPLGRDEIAPYLGTRLRLVGDRTVDQLFDGDAVQELARQADELRTPLNINNTAVAALNCAHYRGEERVTAEIVTDVLSAAARGVAGARELQAWGSA